MEITGISARIIELRNHLKLSQKALSDALDVSQKTISYWESGRNEPQISQLRTLCKLFSVRLVWLVDGKGEMLESRTSSNSALTAPIDERTHLVNIPYFEDTYAAAGHGAVNYDAAPSVISFDFEFLKSILGISSFHNLHIIKAIGDSMEPVITSGELLFVNPVQNDGHSIASGGIYVVRYYDDYLVKKIDRNAKTKELTLISENTIYANVLISGSDLEHCTIIGRVVGHFDRL